MQMSYRTQKEVVLVAVLTEKVHTQAMSMSIVSRSISIQDFLAAYRHSLSYAYRGMAKLSMKESK